MSVRGWTRPVELARKRLVSSGRGERGHPRPRQREGPDGYEFCGAGRSRHWEGWSRRSRRNRAATTRIPAAAGGGPSAGRDGSRPAVKSVCEGNDESRWSREKSIRSSLLRQGLPEREAVEGDAPEGAAAEQRGVDGSLFCAEGI